MLNKEKINALLLKLCSAVGLEDAPEVTPEAVVVLAVEEIEPEAPAVEEPSEVDTLKAENAELKAQLEALKGELEALKGEKSTTEAENTELKEKLSAVENTPADPKITLSAQPVQLSAAQKHLQALRAMK